MGVVGRILLELACKLQRSDMETRRLMEFEPRLKQPCDHSGTVANVQFAAQHAPVESIGDLEGLEVRSDAGDVLGNPGLEGVVGSRSKASFFLASIAYAPLGSYYKVRI